jgi:hypothetical protein
MIKFLTSRWTEFTSPPSAKRAPPMCHQWAVAAPTGGPYWPLPAPSGPAAWCLLLLGKCNAAPLPALPPQWMKEGSGGPPWTNWPAPGSRWSSLGLSGSGHVAFSSAGRSRGHMLVDPAGCWPGRSRGRGGTLASSMPWNTVPTRCWTSPPSRQW